jgi:post-segregation antitoxin (ccd killing protein)
MTAVVAEHGGIKRASRQFTGNNLTVPKEGLCQAPSWNENMSCFSNVAINSENISRRYSHY